MITQPNNTRSQTSITTARQKQECTGCLPEDKLMINELMG